MLLWHGRLSGLPVVPMLISTRHMPRVSPHAPRVSILTTRQHYITRDPESTGQLELWRASTSLAFHVMMHRAGLARALSSSGRENNERRDVESVDNGQNDALARPYGHGQHNAYCQNTPLRNTWVFVPGVTDPRLVVGWRVEDRQPAGLAVSLRPGNLHSRSLLPCYNTVSVTESHPLFSILYTSALLQRTVQRTVQNSFF